MSKKQRIKDLEGYTKDLERRIETLEGWSRLFPRMQKLCQDHTLRVETALRFGSRSQHYDSDYLLDLLSHVVKEYGISGQGTCGTCDEAVHVIKVSSKCEK